MPKRKVSIPVVGDVVRTSSKGLSKVAMHVSNAADRTPIIGSIKTTISSGIKGANRFVNRVPLIGNVKQGLTKGIGKVTTIVPVVSNAKMGMKDASRARDNKKKKTGVTGVKSAK